MVGEESEGLTGEPEPMAERAARLMRQAERLGETACAFDSVIPSESEGSGWAGGLESRCGNGICATLPPDSSLTLGMTGLEGRASGLTLSFGDCIKSP